MVDATTPGTAVEPVGEDQLEGAFEDLFNDTPSAKPKEQEAPTGQPDAEGLTPDDVPEEQEAAAPVDGAEFEIVHNGQQHKLTRADTLKLAQQGFDYTQKTQDLARQRGNADAVLRRAAQIEQLIPHVAQDLAQVKALESQISQFSKAIEQAGGWVAIASSDPLEYPKYQAQFAQLQNAYQAAAGQYQHKAQTILQERQNLTAYQLQQEAAQLRERIPEWRDPAKYEAGAQELRGYLINQGADPAEVDTLSSSLAVSIARKAMLYDKLVYQKHSKSKQLRSAPPVVRPGAAPSSDAGKVSFAKAQQALRNAGKTGTARKQEEILLGMLNRTFKS
jgi:hypothetical protein